MNAINEVFETVLSITIAILRFFFLVIALIPSGLHVIFFTRTEICNIELKGLPYRCDREKIANTLSFVDKMCLENPELLELADNPPPPEDFSDEGDEEG